MHSGTFPVSDSFNAALNRNIKALELSSHTLWLAPLAGYTDQAFRRICKEWGADVLMSEMVSADGLVQMQKRTNAYLKFLECERPYGIQIFGSKPEIMAEAAALASETQPDFIDINMGCPVKKVVNRGAGSGLMKDPDTAFQIVSAVRAAMPEDMPLSVKMRSGWNNEELNYIEFGTAIQEAGADIIILHPRTAKQMFFGTSNWEHIKELKKHLFVPLIGNGDIKTRDDALRMLSETGCDGVMIGRGAIGNPWIFAQIKRNPRSKTEFIMNNKLKHFTIMTQIKYALQDKPERQVAKELKSQIHQYIKGLPHCAQIRERINHTNGIDELKALIDEAFIVPNTGGKDV